MAKSPEQCTDMSEVREGVDEIDRAMMELLETRFGYMAAAARIKQTRESVRDEARKAEVIEAVRKDAAARDLPADELAAIWNRLVEASIAYEFDVWDRLGK